MPVRASTAAGVSFAISEKWARLVEYAVSRESCVNTAACVAIENIAINTASQRRLHLTAYLSSLKCNHSTTSGLLTSPTFLHCRIGCIWRLDLFSRKVIGWSMKSTLAKEIVLDAILMAVWRRKPTKPVIIHSDQGSQYSSGEWKRFCELHQLQVSMSHRGNCYDNVVAKSFFSSLKKINNPQFSDFLSMILIRFVA